MTNKRLLIAAALLTLHMVLALWAATRLAPAWDEIAYPYSGYVQLTTGSLRHYPLNPFLSRLMSGAPFLLTTVETKPSDNPAVDGFQFTYNRQESPRTIILLGRLSAVIFSALLAFLLYSWTRRLWGETGGLITLAAYLTTPILLSRASLALVEMPMFFFIALAFYLNEDRPRLSALSMGLALLCKFTALPAFAALVLFELAQKRFKRALIYVGIVTATVLVSYLPWKGGWDALRAAIGAAFWFNKTMPYYFHGAFLQNAPGFLSLAALALKAPLFTVLLALWGFSVGWKEPNKRNDLKPFLFLAGAYLLFGAAASAPVSTIQLSPLYLAAVFFCGALGPMIVRMRAKILVLTLVLLSVVDVYGSYPNHLAYFNWAAGGVKSGPHWLADSDQDWGQSLPALAPLVKKNPQALFFFSYSGAGRPEAHGFPYVDFFSPALTSRFHIDEPLFKLNENRPIFFVLSAKVAQAYGGAFQWVTAHRRPKQFVGQAFYVYDVTKDAEFLGWMSDFYGATGRSEKAAWCAAQSALASTNTASRK